MSEEFDERVREMRREIEQSLVSFLSRSPEEVDADWVTFCEAKVERLNAMPFEGQLRVFAMVNGVEEIDVEKWKETVSALRWNFKPATADTVACLSVDVLLARPIEQVYFTARVSARDPLAVYDKVRGWHMACTFPGCPWFWELRSDSDQEEIERGRAVHRSHHEHDHPIDLSEFEEKA